MKLLIGQFAIILLISGGIGLSFFILTSYPNKMGFILLTWSLIYIPIGLWSRSNPKTAFLVALILYVISIAIHEIIIGGEYLLPFLFHIYFISSMLIAMNLSISKSISDKNGR